jgi:hypothetical protein
VRAPFRAVPRNDRAAVRTNDGVDDRQPESTAASLSRVGLAEAI